MQPLSGGISIPYSNRLDAFSVMRNVNLSVSFEQAQDHDLLKLFHYISPFLTRATLQWMRRNCVKHGHDASVKQ